MSVIRPAKQYMQKVVNEKLKPQLDAFKAIAIMVPFKARLAGVSTDHIDTLARCLPFFEHNPALMAKMKEELPLYATLCEDATATVKLQDWWQANAELLPGWAQAVRMVLTLTPSSAAAERVFSMMKSMFKKEQECLLTDAIEAAIGLRYNSRELAQPHPATELDLGLIQQLAN
jgi:hypothetical protein